MVRYPSELRLPQFSVYVEEGAVYLSDAGQLSLEQVRALHDWLGRYLEAKNAEQARLVRR